MPGAKRKAAKAPEEESTPKKLTVAQEKERARQWAKEQMQKKTASTSPDVATSERKAPPPPPSASPALTRRGRPKRVIEVVDDGEEEMPVVRAATLSSRKPAARSAPQLIHTPPLTSQSPLTTNPKLSLYQEKERARLWAESQKRQSVSPAPHERQSSVSRKSAGTFSATKHVVNVFHYCLQSVTLVIEVTFIALAISAGIAYYSNEKSQNVLELAVENLIPVTIIYFSLMSVMVAVLAYGYVESFFTRNLQIPLLVVVVAGAIVYLKPELIQQFK